MLLLVIPQGTGAAQLDVADALADVLYRLGFGGAADLAQANSWVTSAELYQFADDAARKLAWSSGVFITYDTSITVAGGTAQYAQPATHVFTVAGAIAGAPLRLTTVAELWALDATWPAATGTPRRASLDAGGVGTITLYPSPVAGGTLGQVAAECAARIAAGASTVSLPTVLRDYFGYAMLAGARGKESDFAMPEMAAHFAQRMVLYEKVIEHLWGPGA